MVYYLCHYWFTLNDYYEPDISAKAGKVGNRRKIFRQQYLDGGSWRMEIEGHFCKRIYNPEQGSNRMGIS
jgi:hypothetical protein